MAGCLNECPHGQALRFVHRQPQPPTDLFGKAQHCVLTILELQRVASNMYPPESLGDFTQTLFLQGKTNQSTFRCKLALFLYCLLDRQNGAGGHKLKLESFRCTTLFMCAFVSICHLPGSQTTKNNSTDLHIKQHRGLSTISAES